MNTWVRYECSPWVRRRVCYIKTSHMMFPRISTLPPRPSHKPGKGVKSAPYLVWLLLEAGEAQGEDRTGPGSMTHGLVTFLNAPWSWVWGWLWLGVSLMKDPNHPGCDLHSRIKVFPHIPPVKAGTKKVMAYTYWFSKLFLSPSPLSSYTGVKGELS